MAREYRIPPVRIRCMAWDQYQKLKRRYKGRDYGPCRPMVVIEPLLLVEPTEKNIRRIHQMPFAEIYFMKE